MSTGRFALAKSPAQAIATCRAIEPEGDPRARLSERMMIGGGAACTFCSSGRGVDELTKDLCGGLPDSVLLMYVFSAVRVIAVNSVN
jgi:hypothetical protein